MTATNLQTNENSAFDPPGIDPLVHQPTLARLARQAAMIDRAATESNYRRLERWQRDSAPLPAIVAPAYREPPPIPAPALVEPVETFDRSQFFDPSSWDGQPVPDRTWYLEGLIPSRTVTMLSGDGGLGKSLLALQLAIASATCGETMGLQPKAGRVVYVGAEDEADEFHRRTDSILRACGRSYGDLADQFRLLPLADQDATLASPDKAGKLQATPLLDALFDEVVEFRPVLVVLDTSADLFGGDEIKRAQVRQFVAMLRSVAMAGDCAVLLLSHPSQTGMTSGSGTSGSTAWNNSVRSRLYLTAPTGDEADPDARSLTNMKSNYGRKGDALQLRWHDGVFIRDDGSTPNLAAGLVSKADDELFAELLRKLCRLGQRPNPTPCGTYAPKLMADLPEGRGVGKKRFESAMRRLLEKGTIKIIEDGPASKKRRHLMVAADDFGSST